MSSTFIIIVERTYTNFVRLHKDMSKTSADDSMNAMNGTSPNKAGTHLRFYLINHDDDVIKVTHSHHYADYLSCFVPYSFIMIEPQ